MKRFHFHALFMTTVTFCCILSHAQYRRNPAYPPEPDWVKQEAIAYLLAVGGTALPIAAGIAIANEGNEPLGGTLIVSGIMLGPSLGQFYAESPWQGLLGVSLRVGGAALTAAGMGMVGQALICDLVDGKDEPGVPDTCRSGLGVPMAILGVGVFWFGAVYSFVDTHLSVTRMKRRRVLQFGGIQPTLMLAAREGASRAGATVVFRF